MATSLRVSLVQAAFIRLLAQEHKRSEHGEMLFGLEAYIKQQLATLPKILVYKVVLDLFIKSPDFERGVVSATKAGWGSDLYYVELLEDGQFFVVDGKRIGNAYQSPGVVLTLPTLDCNDYQEIVVDGGLSEEEYFALALDNERDELSRDLHEALKGAIS